MAYIKCLVLSNIVPNGQTVTPVNDVQIWLHCADIWDKSYTTVADVLNDGDTLFSLLMNDNADRYMVRSTSWADTICANGYAMGVMGSYDDCANKVVNNSTWLIAVGNSNYASNFFNIKVPIMTSNNAPRGECYASSLYSGYSAYQAFNNSTSGSISNVSKNNKTSWSYVFNKKVPIYCCHFEGYRIGSPSGTISFDEIKVYIGDDNNNYSSAGTGFGQDDTSQTFYNYNVLLNDYVSEPYPRQENSYKLEVLACNNYPCVRKLQFYGRDTGGVQSWLHAGGITNRNYTTLAELVVEYSLLENLLKSQSATAYLLNAKGLMDDIASNSAIMQAIGNNDNCVNTLLTNPDWVITFINSEYSDYIFNVKVPVMTSATAPSGTVFYTGSVASGATIYPYKVFSASPSQQVFSGAPFSIGYQFTKQVKIYGFYAQTIFSTTNRVADYKIQGSNNRTDSTSWVDLYSDTAPDTSIGAYQSGALTNVGIYDSYRFYCSTNRSGNTGIIKLQFYGRENV